MSSPSPLGGFDTTLADSDTAPGGFDAALADFDAVLGGFDAALGDFDAVLGGSGLRLGGAAMPEASVTVLTVPRPEHWLVHSDGRRSRLPVRRWHGPPEPAVESVAARCAGPTIDLGCGPGRLAVALARRGLVSLGVDISAEAVRLVRAQGAVALRRDVFDPLPGEGRWAHALLIDGNIGIGGDPVRLLRRCSALIATDGTLLVELAPPGTGLWQGRAHVWTGMPGPGFRRGPAFRWARVGVEAVGRIATVAGLRVVEIFPSGPRWFAELVRR